MLASRSLAPYSLAAVLSFAVGCLAPLAPPPEALALAPISDAEREMQTHTFETDDEEAVLRACVAVLVRHGFAAEDQDHELGVIVASKDAPDGRGRSRLRASLATQPAGEFGGQIALRLTFQRLAWNARGREIKREGVRAVGEYDGFFREVTRELGAQAEARL